MKNPQEKLAILNIRSRNVTTSTRETTTCAWIYDVRMAQFVLKIEKLSHIIGPRASQDLRSPSPIMAPDPTTLNESPQRLTKFNCGFHKCHSVCSKNLGSFFCHDIANFNPANWEMFRVTTFVNFSFFSTGEKINKWLRRSIRFPL